MGGLETADLGAARAKLLALSGDPLDPEAAADWRWLSKSVPDEALAPEAEALAEQLAAGRTLGLGRANKAIHAVASNPREARSEFERECRSRVGYSQDHAEGGGAFLDMRELEFPSR